MRRVWLVLSFALLSACATTPPSKPLDICEIFREKDDWYGDALKSEKRWGSPIPTMMAIMYQESAYYHKARPPKKYWLGFIPAGRISDAYGYPQAKDATWRWYKEKTNRWGADRDDFEDAIDFIGWYNDMSRRQSGISLDDPYHLYLAYHEGHGGFNRRTFRNKSWLKRVATRVAARSATYDRQLQTCRKEFEGNWFFRLF